MIRHILPLLLAAQAFGATFSDSLAFRGQASAGGLLAGLQAAWNFDEQFGTPIVGSPTNRFSDFGGMVFTNVGALTGEEGTLTSGGVSITNNGAGYLNLTNTGVFGINASFTMAFWACGSISGGASTAIGQHISNATFDYLWDSQQTFNIVDGGGTTRSAIGASSASPTTWMLVVCGFDQANSQVFISQNGGARVNAACASVRQTANMPMRITCNPMVIDNFYFWNRVLTTAEITSLYNSGSGAQYPFNLTPGGQRAYAWAWNITNLSGTVTANNIANMVTLCDAFQTAGILTRTTCLIPFVSTSLQAALTSPINSWNIHSGNAYIAQRSRPYTDLVAFVGGDLSANGLTGNGSTKYTVLFGGNPGGGISQLMPSPVDAGYLLYIYNQDTSVANHRNQGTYDSGAVPNPISVSGVNSGVSSYIAYLGGAGSTISTNTLPNGFFSIQRVSNTELDGYFANSVKAHYLYAQDTTASGVASWRFNYQYALFDYFDAVGGGIGAGYFSASTLSFFATFSSHLTSTESAAAYTAVQAFRTSEGGGFR